MLHTIFRHVTHHLIFNSLITNEYSYKKYTKRL